jgi:hypothetical protein
MQKIDDLGWVAEATYKIGDTRFGIRTNSEVFADWLEYALADYRMKRWVNPYFSVFIGDNASGSSRRNFNILYAGANTFARTLELPRLARTLLVELESLEFTRRRDAIFANAAVVEVKGTRALVPKELARSLVSLGSKVKRASVEIPTDMFVGVTPVTGKVLPVPLTLSLPDDAFARLADLAPSSPDESQPRGGGEGDVDAVVIFGGNRGSLLQPVSRAVALRDLAARTFNLDQHGRQGLEGLASLVGGARCYAVGAGGADAHLDALALATG